MNEAESDESEEPEVWARLESSLDVYQDEHESLFRNPESTEEVRLHEAMIELRRHAFDVLTTGRLPNDLADRLASYEPGSAVESKVLNLLGYNLVQHRIEFDIAWEVVARLRDVNKRVRVGTLAFALLLHSDPSETAVKYFRKAAALFLAGYDAEVAVMCGAVLEAAISARLDDALRAAAIRPAYRRTGDYSIAQRMHYEIDHPFLNVDQREMFWKVLNWRNDAVHVQPDLTPSPDQPLVFTANLLGVILPRSIP